LIGGIQLGSPYCWFSNGNAKIGQHPNRNARLLGIQLGSSYYWFLNGNARIRWEFRRKEVFEMMNLNNDLQGLETTS
jgi:hypothetical protein